MPTPHTSAYAALPHELGGLLGGHQCLALMTNSTAHYSYWNLQTLIHEMANLSIQASKSELPLSFGKERTPSLVKQTKQATLQFAFSA
jgi:hypothetical protein